MKFNELMVAKERPYEDCTSDRLMNTHPSFPLFIFQFFALHKNYLLLYNKHIDTNGTSILDKLRNKISSVQIESVYIKHI